MVLHLSPARSKMIPSQKRARRAKLLIKLSAVIYVLALLAVTRMPTLPQSISAVLVATTFVAGLAMIVFGVQAGRHSDELERLVYLKALSVAFVGLAVLAFIAMILPLGIATPLPDRISWVDLWVLLSVLWTAGFLWAYRHHR